MKHWIKRCRECGIVEEDPEELYHTVFIWIRTGRISKIATIKGGDFYRFHCNDGTFYAVTEAGAPGILKTIFTQEMYRKTRNFTRKHQNGKHPRRKNSKVLAKKARVRKHIKELWRSQS